ncbi:DUF6571 family protein [Nonomuraea wenchangensis]|uniref:DUF6571 domain-containing protein n=1 Tax=Nonomuraea wenchangensis TaxID=568860 RepID=A0A1I0LRL5_9ACTN|nr:DUF6571 family protein [Nonomuraea wenchangensis]SEU43241.1 hypothetical protein SAMN05421811_12176 [Nonomuraea wenchangensis]
MTPGPTTPLAIDPTLMTQLISLMKRLSQTVPETGAQVDKALSTVQLSMSGPGTARDIAHQIGTKVPELQRRLDLMLAAQKVALSRSQALWADESQWVSDTPAAGAATAARLAAALRTAMKKGTIDAKTLADLQKHQNDPYFAIAFATQLSPRELKQLLTSLYRRNTTVLGADPEAIAELDKLSAALSTTLGTASRGAGPLKLPKGYVDQLLEHLDTPETAFALNKLLRTGHFDDTFLRELATKVYDYERKQPPGSLYWRNMTPTTQPANDLPAAYKDPLAAVAAALAHNPRAAQDFLTDPQRKPLDYLMRERTWYEATDSDLGHALEAATTTFRDHDLPPGGSRGYKSALIASWALHFWTNPSAQSNLPNTRQSVGNILSSYMSDLNRAAEDRVAHNPGVISRDPDTNLKGTQPYGAILDRDGIKGVMRWTFADPAVLKTVVTAQGKYSIDVLNERAAEIAKLNRADFEKWHRAHPQATTAEINAQRQKILEGRMTSSDGATFGQAIERLSRTLYVITDAGNIANITKADQHDKVFAAFKEAITSVADLVPGPQGKIAGLLFDKAKSEVYGKFTGEQGAAARSQANTTIGQTIDMFTDITADAMMQHGLFGDGEVPTRTHPYASLNFPRGSAGDFMNGKKIIPWSQMTADQREAYTEWLNNPDTGAVFRDPSNAVGEGFDQATRIEGQGG